MIINLHSHLQSLIKSEIEKNRNSKWKTDTKFYNQKLLSIDQRGRVGEYFIRDVFKELNYKVEYIDNAHNDYDMIVNKLKIEIKTATLDKNNKFQHEGIKQNYTWDLICFLDICPNNLYITFVKYSDFNFNDGLTKTNNIKGNIHFNNMKQNIHFRGKDKINKRATGSGFKVDFKLGDLLEIKTIKDFEDSFLSHFK